jgi:hypothetical protein
MSDVALPLTQLPICVHVPLCLASAAAPAAAPALAAACPFSAAGSVRSFGGGLPQLVGLLSALW